MECEVCRIGVFTSTGPTVTLFRMNVLGEVGIWRCRNCLPPGTEIDPVAEEICRIIEEG